MLYCGSLPFLYSRGKERQKSALHSALCECECECQCERESVCIYVCVCVCVCVLCRDVGVQPVDHLKCLKEFPALERSKDGESSSGFGSRIMEPVLYSAVSEQSMCECLL